MSLTIFDHIDNLTMYKRFCDDEDLKTFDVYMVNRWLSMDKDLIEFVNAMQIHTSVLNKKQVYRMYMSMLPQKKLRNQYVKRGGEGKYEKDLVELMKKYFGVNKDVALHYLDILFMEEKLDEVYLILRKYGKTDKEIKKLIKTNK